MYRRFFIEITWQVKKTYMKLVYGKWYTKVIYTFPPVIKKALPHKTTTNIIISIFSAEDKLIFAAARSSPAGA